VLKRAPLQGQVNDNGTSLTQWVQPDARGGPHLARRSHVCRQPESSSTSIYTSPIRIKDKVLVVYKTEVITRF